jgi:phage/plasmid-associated DNA primase
MEAAVEGVTHEHHDLLRNFRKPVNQEMIEAMSRDDFHNLLDTYHNVIVEEQPPVNERWWADWARGHVDPYIDACQDNVYKAWQLHSDALTRLMGSFQTNHWDKENIETVKDLTLGADCTREVERKFRELFVVLYYVYESVATYQQLCAASNGDEDEDEEEEEQREAGQEAADKREMEMSITTLEKCPSVWRAMYKPNTYQQLTFHILNCLQRSKVRRNDNDCYRERYITTDASHEPTCYWEQACSVSQFIYECIPKETCFDLWCKMNSRNRKEVEKSICTKILPEFPVLKESPYIFSFRNGLYDAWKNEFASFSVVNERRAKDPTYDPVAVQFIDLDFDPSDATEDDFMDIDTPEFDTLFKTQGYTDDEEIMWALALLGRVIYPVNKRDRWQVGIFIKGNAGSGKSMLGNLIKWIFPPHQVATLSSNAETTFGLSAIIGKRVYVCTEVKKNFSLNQGDWQSMVTGEDVTVNIKGETAQVQRPWTIPGILCGNEYPGWLDSQGSVVRRVVSYVYDKFVEDPDPNLEKKLRARLPSLLCKMNRAYIDKSGKYGHRNIWSNDILPESLIKNQKDMQRFVDPIVNFFDEETGLFRHHPDGFVPIKEIKSMYKTFEQENGLGGSQGTSATSWVEKSKNAYDRYGLRVENNTIRTFRGMTSKGPWLLGVQLANSTESDTLTQTDRGVTVQDVADACPFVNNCVF